MAKKKKEVPKKILDKIEEVKNCNIVYKSLDENEIIISIYDHEVYQYLRHRKSGMRTYDPLHTYKKELRKKLEEELKDESIRNIVKNNFVKPIEFELITEKNPCNNTDSIKLILFKLLGIVKRTNTPDVDNFQKTTFDVMNEMFWKDDAQIFKVTSIKKYSSDFTDKTYIRIKYVEDSLEESKGRLDKLLLKKYKTLIDKIKEKRMENK